MLALDTEKEKKESCLGQLSSKVMFNNRPQGHKLKITKRDEKAILKKMKKSSL
jgi:hypothetical protein